MCCGVCDDVAGVGSSFFTMDDISDGGALRVVRCSGGVGVVGVVVVVEMKVVVQ